MDSIASCHDRLAVLLGSNIEPLDVLRRTEEHRSYWRPSRVKVILLAESHVYTTAEELSRTIALPASAPSDIPRGFVRLVYCLGYGENWLLDRKIARPPNTGTPQFWKILFSCVIRIQSTTDFSGIQAGALPERRIAAKIEILQRLRELGVWLVDTSIASVYAPGQTKPSSNTLMACLRASWDHHVAGVVTTADPFHIVCIGRGVASALDDRLRTTGIPISVVPQPNARLSSAEHRKSFETYYEVVRSANGFK